MIENKFEKCPRSVGVWHGCRSVRHGYSFIIEVPMLHRHSCKHTWIDTYMSTDKQTPIFIGNMFSIIFVFTIIMQMLLFLAPHTHSYYLLMSAWFDVLYFKSYKICKHIVIWNRFFLFWSMHVYPLTSIHCNAYTHALVSARYWAYSRDKHVNRLASLTTYACSLTSYACHWPLICKFGCSYVKTVCFYIFVGYSGMNCAQFVVFFVSWFKISVSVLASPMIFSINISYEYWQYRLISANILG